MSNEPVAGKKPPGPLRIAASAVGGVYGYYCGIMIVLPLAGALVAVLLAKRFASENVKPFVPAVAIIFGHLTWMLIAVLIVHAGLAAVIIDIVIIVAGLLWLVVRPGLGPVILLGLYEAFSLVMNIHRILGCEFGTSVHKALAAHIGLRVCALACLISGYRQFQKRQADPSVSPPLDNA